jgi:hypothetical protein
MTPYEKERQKERWAKRFWINGLLIEADTYADALHFADLINDDLSVEQAERDSDARLVT